MKKNFSLLWMQILELANGANVNAMMDYEHDTH